MWQQTDNRVKVCSINSLLFAFSVLDLRTISKGEGKDGFTGQSRGRYFREFGTKMKKEKTSRLDQPTGAGHVHD